jgi:hypothetical protein
MRSAGFVEDGGQRVQVLHRWRRKRQYSTADALAVGNALYEIGSSSLSLGNVGLLSLALR